MRRCWRYQSRSAELGPLAGIVILVVLGLINVLTVSLMAESVARSGAMRYRNAFLGRLVEGYLGSRSALGLSVLLIATSFIELPLYYVGLGATLEDVTSLPAAVWVAALFVVTLLFVRRGSLDATVGAALVVGVLNLALLFALAGIAFGHVDGSNLLHADIPFTGGTGVRCCRSCHRLRRRTRRLLRPHGGDLVRKPRPGPRPELAAR